MNKLSGSLIEGGSSQPIERPIAPSLERRRLRAYTLLLLFDAVLLHLAFATAGLLYEGEWWIARNMLAVQTLLPVYFTIALYNQTYGGKALGDWVFASRQALTALVISAALVNFFAFYTKSNAEFSRVSVTLGFIFSAVAIVGLRRLVPMVIARFWGGRTMNRLVIDDGGPDFELENSLKITASEYDLDPSSHDPFMLDRLGKLLQNQDKVVVSTPRERRDATTAAAVRRHGAGAQEEETWNVAIHLVWYPFNQARCAINSPFHPLFRVADNGLFLLNTQD